MGMTPHRRGILPPVRDGGRNFTGSINERLYMLAFLVQGGVVNRRQLCDPYLPIAALVPIFALCAGEAYCSHFVFVADALLSHHRANPMLSAFSCVHWAPFIYIDIRTKM